MNHRCAVCWESQATHAEWFEHAVEQHGASLAEFGMATCPANPKTCVGVQYALRTPRRGTTAPRRVREPQPYVAKDGTVYTPVPLPIDESAA